MERAIEESSAKAVRTSQGCLPWWPRGAACERSRVLVRGFGVVRWPLKPGAARLQRRRSLWTKTAGANSLNGTETSREGGRPTDTPSTFALEDGLSRGEIDDPYFRVCAECRTDWLDGMNARPCEAKTGGASGLTVSEREA